MRTQTYKVQEAKNHLPRLLQEVTAGTEVIITKTGIPIARISRIEDGRQIVRFGLLRGKAKVADDFDAPLPDNILSEFEGRECSS